MVSWYASVRISLGLVVVAAVWVAPGVAWAEPAARLQIGFGLSTESSLPAQSEGGYLGTTGLGLFAVWSRLPPLRRGLMQRGNQQSSGLAWAFGGRANLGYLVKLGSREIDDRAAPAWSLGPELRLGYAWRHPKAITEAYLGMSSGYARVPYSEGWAPEGHGGTYYFRAVAGLALLNAWWAEEATDTSSARAFLTLIPSTFELGVVVVGGDVRAVALLGLTVGDAD